VRATACDELGGPARLPAPLPRGMEADAGTGSAVFFAQVPEPATLPPANGTVPAPLPAAVPQPDMPDTPGVELEQYGDLAEYARSLGVDPDRDEDLLWVVQEAFNAPLPGSWAEFTDGSGRVFYFNEASSQSTWEHPMDRVYRELLEVALRVRDERLGASEAQCAVTNHLREVHQRALAAIAGWSGPYPSDMGEYYYNEAAKVSAWENPVAEWERELVSRYEVLHRCVLAELPEFTGLDEAAGQPGVGGLGCDSCGHDFLRALRLDLGMLQRDPSLPGPETPHTPYLTARSTAQSERSSRSGRRKRNDEDRRAARAHEGAVATQAAQSAAPPLQQPAVFSGAG